MTYGAREYVGRATRSILLDRAIVEEDFVAAAGDRLKQKIDFDRIEEGTLEWFLCIEGLKSCVHDNFGPSRLRPIRAKIDAVLTVGSGATELGGPLADELRIRHIPAHKDRDGNFYIDSEVRDEHTGIIIDDVYRTGLSMRKVQSVGEALGITTVGAVAVFNRSSNTAPELMPGVPVRSVIYKNMEE